MYRKRYIKPTFTVLSNCCSLDYLAALLVLIAAATADIDPSFYNMPTSMSTKFRT